MSIEITSQFNNKAGKPLDANSIKSTIAERDAITDRYIGLRVFVEETLTHYILETGITNNDWVIYKTDWNAKSGSITELVNKPTPKKIFNLAANNPSVGDYCHAGLIVYKAVAGDIAYGLGYETVLVAALTNFSESVAFSNIINASISDERGLGVGRSNTLKILGQSGYSITGGATVATNYYPNPTIGFTEEGSADMSWSVPSIEEMQKVMIYKTLLDMNGIFMTSNDASNDKYWTISTTGQQQQTTKTSNSKLRGVCWIKYYPRISGNNTGDETPDSIISKIDLFDNAGSSVDYTGALGTRIPTIVINPINNQRNFFNLNLNGIRGSIDLRVFSHDIVWDGDWISVSIGNNTDFIQAHLLNKVDIIIETGFGVMNSSGLAKLVPGTGERLLKIICLDGRLNLETDFSRVIFRFYPSLYNTQFGTSKWVNRVYGETLLQSSPNIIINGTSSAPSHSTYMRDTFVWCYNKYGTFSGSSYITNLDSSLPTEPIAGEAVPGRLPSGKYASYPRSKSSDIILNAFQNSLITTDMASMPDIYNIVCHGRDPIPLTAVTLTAGTTTVDNYYGWVNYTATTPADGCVVRFTGLTNNPTLNNVDLKVIAGTSTKFGLSFLDGTRIRFTSNDSGTMIKGIGGEFNFYKYYEPDNINTSSFFAVNSIAVGAGKLSDSDANWQSSYGQGVEFIESTVSDDMIGCPVSWWNLQQQSPAVAIVAAKIKYIKDTTNVSWSTVRMACRETALQSTYNITNNIKWDKYRGFGVIRVTEAITWINLRKSSSRNTIKNSLSLGTLPTYINSSNSIPDMHPLPKKLAQEKITFNNTIEQQTLIDTDKVLIQDTIGSFKWISFANLKRQLGLQVGQKYLGGTIIKLDEDNNSGVIASYFEFKNTYDYAMINYGTIGTYVKDGYSNWRLPHITELDLIFQYSKPERDIIGDVNGDGIVNQLDKSIIEQATNLFIDNTHPSWNTKWFKADINGDGMIDSDDVTLIENLINNNQWSMYQYEKYLAYDISDINPTTSCKGYVAPVLTISGGVISQTPHVLTELLKTDTVGIRLVRNF